MKLTREEVLRVAELAHLELSPEEVELYRGQLDEILNYIGKLEQLDVSNVEPMAQVLFTPGRDLRQGTASAVPKSHEESGVSTPEVAGSDHPELRDDTLRPCDIADAVLAQAPDAANHFFRVPKVIDR
jgi:aspartyl-tRNA(Asn)/glutamyl-tRNA(Gln) amidotransferase subunit C